MKVLLATDGSSTADAALEVVLYRPWEPGTEVRVINVVEPLHHRVDSLVNLFGLGSAALDAQKKFHADMHSLVKKYEERLAAKLGADKVSSVVLEGRDKEKIMEEARAWGADTIVLGAHGHTEPAEFLFGSVPEFMLSHAPCAVEILRQANLSTMVAEIEKSHPVEEDKYLIALDDSECASTTLDEILRRKWPEKAFFRVICVVEPLPFQAYSGLGPWEDTSSTEFAELVEKTYESERQVAQKIVDNAVQKLSEKFKTADISSDVLDGRAKECIVNYAREWPADLLIMGSHGRRGFAEFVIGSVSKASALHAPCSVLVVRPPEAKGDLGKNKAATAKK
ncbi:MAG: universal stress protein [Candidatus Obscuribacterales bacterium]|nr:universal stress protein [Candidatus Obscuribacterales bacterium]